MLLHDNAILYVIRVTRGNSMTQNVEVSPHPRHSTGYHLFRSLQHFKKGLLLAKRLKLIMSVFALKPKYFYARAIKNFQNQWDY